MTIKSFECDSCKKLTNGDPFGYREEGDQCEICYLEAQITYNESLITSNLSRIEDIRLAYIVPPERKISEYKKRLNELQII